MVLTKLPFKKTGSGKTIFAMLGTAPEILQALADGGVNPSHIAHMDDNATLVIYYA